MRAAKELVWPGGEHSFRLGIGELRALEQRTNVGSFVSMTRLLTSQWHIDDVVATIRLGLVGAGMPDHEAKKVLEKALDIASPHALAITAATILNHSIMWEEDDAPGELAGETEENASPTD
jgi:hypothetical protein